MGLIENTPIEKLIEEYTEESCDFTDMDWVLKVSRMYVDRMPDTQVRCLLHTLVDSTPLVFNRRAVPDKDAEGVLIHALELMRNPDHDTSRLKVEESARNIVKLARQPLQTIIDEQHVRIAELEDKIKDLEWEIENDKYPDDVR